MSKAMSKEAPLRAVTERLGLDGIILMSPENFAYGSGVHVITVTMIRPRQAFLIVPAKGEVEMVLCSIEVSLAKEEGWVQTIHPYTEFVDHPMDVLAKRLTALGLANGKVGMDTDYLPFSSYQRLIANLPGLTIVNTTEDITTIRAIKTPDEVEILEWSTKGTHRAVLDGMAASKLGDSEKDMCLRIANGILANGADGTAFLCFASGPRTPQAHAMATDRVPLESEIIRFDLGGVYGRFSSDFARTYSTGNPTLLQRQTHAALVRVQRASIAAAVVGITAEDLYYATRDAFQKEGLQFTMPHIGHSFGIELHETPMLRPGEKTKLAPGMVINIEPSTTDETGARYHTEDLLEITEAGPRLMTLGLAPEELPILGQMPVTAA